MKNLKIMCAAGVLLLSSVTSNVAQAGAVVGATEPTQILNNLQLVLAYAEQAQTSANTMNQYAAMLKNLERMTPSSLLDSAAQQLFVDKNMSQAFSDLRNIYSKGQQTAYSLASVNQQFKSNHPGYGGAVDFSSAYRNWSDSSLSAAKNAIKLVTAHSENFATEEGMMNELAFKSQTAAGQLQAAQAGAAISLQMVGQMQKLRQVALAQVQSQNEFAAAAQSEKDAQQLGVEKAFGGVASKSVKGQAN
ncbi:P-type conjugative transfer protein TrbJ [Cupriavidus sp. D39]|uniref:P-type conjugative transfer protein TrbJ n=1 Tax=Cupriavidus sp. D39 TaxID=2997877 RepID=UPI00226FEF16|nr:P-type conjugative transfer protein TrbJ [Cupriavidus sp. D39]MCY0853039.1 P-type conjugative transfer protein TrbJ [Cupriavidus sp. D39]